MRILVTGASGFVGTALCRELLARGHTVRAAVRRLVPPGAVPSQLHQILVPDIAAEFDRRALVDGVGTVVHLAAIAHRSNLDDGELRRVNCDAAIRLAEAAGGSVRRFIFLSSVKVHGEDSGSGTYAEDDTLDPQDSYGRSKLEAERALTETAARNGIELVIIRPPLVYGPEVKANFLRLLGWVDSGLPLPFASVRNRRSLIYVGNLVDAIARFAEHPGARGPFLVSDEESVSTPELISRIARVLERPARLLPAPPALLRVAGMIAGRRDEILRLTGNLAIDSLRARRLLDWRPPHTLDAGLAQTARWFRSARA
ncbi:MAG TPA: NAD-dependent epimerase/dehydratase family protein [Burkholderiales bacterium]|nr:NAD-dependent epimerase/dehydratase family protein [Burkholderiales bacterium]HYT15026.1 NAD-dependent epimerase/dehydratase family protein [Burkholderiales bacterium]